MPCDVRRGESPWDTSWATNPEAGSYQNSEVPPGAGSPTCWGSNGIGQDTLQGASVAPVGGAGGLRICVCTWCQQAWRLPLMTSRPQSDSQLPDFSSNPRARTQGLWHGSTGHSWGEVLRIEPGSGVGGKCSLPIRILSRQVQMYSMGGKHRKPEGEPHSGLHRSRSTGRDRKDDRRC